MGIAGQAAALGGAVRAAPVVDTVVAAVLPRRLIERADIAALTLAADLGSGIAGVAAGAAVFFIRLEAGTGAATTFKPSDIA